MFKNNLKIAWRNIQKRKLYSVINITGLLSSLAFVLLIAAYVWQTYQVNADLKHKDQQYVLQSKYKKADIGIEIATIGALPKALKEEYPHLVANYYRIDGLTCVVSKGDQVYEESVSLGDSTLLDMYGFELLEGDPRTALTTPFSVVITASTAVKYFGKKEVLGENLTIRNFKGEKHDFKVTGILESTARNSVMELNADLKSSIFLPIASEKYFGRDMDNWGNPWIVGFVELQQGVLPEQLEAPISALVTRNADPEIAENLTPQLNPLSSYFLDDNNGSVRKLMHILMLIAGFLLLMAVVNFINFTVSQSFIRLKEIGVRKLMGSSKIQLIFQLITEYTVLVLVAGLGAIGLYPLLKPLFESIMLAPLPSLFELPSFFFVYFTLAVLLLGILSGLYPAIKLSQNHLMESLKNQFSSTQNKYSLRHVLLFVQFTVAIVVLIAAIVISRQVDLFTEGDLGYDKDYLITLQTPRDWSEAGLHKMEMARDALRTLSYIEDISLSYDVPGAISNNIQEVKRVGNENAVNALTIISDRYFSDAYHIPLLAGQFFSATHKTNTDDTKLVINNKAARELGYDTPEEAIGQQIGLDNNQFIGTIAGVTDDFYAQSMHNATPLVMWVPVQNSNYYRFFSIRLKAGSSFEVLTRLEKKWKELFPEAPFEFHFIDDTVKNMYRSELQLQRASQTATLISLIIIVLGLIGLTAMNINLRLKEIGIRKVLGASFREIIALFSKEFYVTFLMAMLVGCPLVYFLMYKWLASYTMRTELHMALFVVPLMGLILLLFAIIGSVVLRSTRANPVDALKEE